MTGPRLRAAYLLLILSACMASWSRPANAATYLPLQDADLARRSPIIVRAEVVNEEVEAVESNGQMLPFTRTRLRTIEVLKGSLTEEVFAVRVAGGRTGKTAWLVAGRPTFQPRQQVVLFLHPLADTEDYVLSEFALSKFDIVEDGERTLYALRSTFEPKEERYLSGPEAASQPVDALRELEPFLQNIRQMERQQTFSPVRYRVPSGSLRVPRRAGLAPLWVNIIGREPGDCGRTPCLVFWFFHTGDSPNAVVFITGAQTNLSDSSNGSAAVAAAVTGWSTIAGTQVRFSGPAAPGNVEVKMDQATHPSGTWTTAIDCGGGVLGVGGPQFQIRPLNFKGDSYFPAQNGTVLMRQNTCSTGYPANRFASVVLHETGHVLGLGHPDVAQSTHSTTGPNEWNAAVMRSSLAASVPTTPQTDDIQAFVYYYGTGSASACVPGTTTLCLAGGRFAVQATWRNAAGQTGPGMAISLTPDTGYFWFFSATNVEMVIKVLATCAINQRFWVFAGGLTDVQVTLTVTDTNTGTVKVYNNPQGTAFLPIQDTGAFATCP